MNELTVAIKELEKSTAPKRYVRSKVTNVRRRALTAFEEAGLRAKTFCSWRYVCGDFEMRHDAPATRNGTCDARLPSLRASL